MKATLLLLEGVEKEIENEVRNQLGEHSETSEYERVLSEIEGRPGENQQSTIFVDVTKFSSLNSYSGCVLFSIK